MLWLNRHIAKCCARPAQSSLLSPLSRWPPEGGSLGYGIWANLVTFHWNDPTLLNCETTFNSRTLSCFSQKNEFTWRKSICEWMMGSRCVIKLQVSQRDSTPAPMPTQTPTPTPTDANHLKLIGWIDLIDSPSLIGWKSRLFGCRLKPDIQDIPKERAEHSRAGSTPIYLLLEAFIIWEVAIMMSCS